MPRLTNIASLLACPKCKAPLRELCCGACGVKYPTLEGIPVLLNEENSLFSTEDVLSDRDTTYHSLSAMQSFLKGMLPSIYINPVAAGNLRMYFEILSRTGNEPLVLIVGGAVAGAGMKHRPKNIRFVETDVAVGPNTSLVCDGHDLPFRDGVFDGVIVQSVLEHVLHPFRCVDEIHRVLRPEGVVYAETPFMQQVHAGRYDFFRFSHLGHRYLFKEFEEIRSGPCSGAGTALAWSYCYFLQSFFRSRKLGRAAFGIGQITGFWLKYFDHILLKSPSAFDAASAYYFMGQKRSEGLSAEELLAGYKGAIGR